MDLDELRNLPAVPTVVVPADEWAQMVAFARVATPLLLELTEALPGLKGLAKMGQQLADGPGGPMGMLKLLSGRS